MKIRVQLTLLTVGLLALASFRASAQTAAPAKSGAQSADQQELEKLEGDWVYVSQETRGSQSSSNPGKTTIKGDQWAIWRPTGGGSDLAVVSILKLKIDASQDPKAMDQSATTGSMRQGIYKLEGDTLTACFSNPGETSRPKEFKTTVAGGTLMVLKRTGAASAIPPASAISSAAAMPPDVKAYSDAMRLPPEKKIEALQKFFADFPTSARTETVRAELIRSFIKAHRDDKEKLLLEVQKLIAEGPETAKSSSLNAAAWEMFLAGAFLNEAERFASESIALLDEQKFIEAQRELAESRKLPVPADDELKKRFRVSLGMVQDTLGQIYLKQGRIDEAEKLLKVAFEANPTAAETAAALADVAQRKGNDTVAFDYLATAAVLSRPPAGTQAKLEALYVKLHKDAKPGSLDAMLDSRYRKLYPTLPVAHYKPTPERSDRTVLAEVFTGSGCPPCVAADLAFDAMMERYSRKELVVLMYHQHIPAPDPMTNPSTQARWKFYPTNRGVPSYLLDGEVVPGGGGSREMTQIFYDRINPKIEQRLEAAADARLTLSATLDGTKAKVKAEASQFKGDAAELKLNVALVEEMLSYSGENGIRLHPVVVRSLAGPEAGGFAIDRAKPGAVEHTFDIASISEELKAHLEDFESKSPSGRTFSQKKHGIDPNNLSVVAFLQDLTTKKILQAAYVRLKPGEVAANQ